MSNPKVNNSWLDVIFKFLRRFTPRQRKIFVSGLIMFIIVALIVSTVVMYAWIKFFGFRIQGGKLFLGVYEPNLSAVVVVDPTAGWQSSGIKLKAGERVRIEASGRIHLAANHVIHLAGLAQSLIISRSPNRNWSKTLVQRYPLPKLDESNLFYRDWIGPEGDEKPSDMLDGCKINKEWNWGVLLTTVIPKEMSNQIDPLRLLKEAGIKPSQLTRVNPYIEFEAQRDGELSFIINEAVLSLDSESEESREFYKALIKAKEDLSNDPRHQLYVSSIPLIWFADNLGSFRVVISRIP